MHGKEKNCYQLLSEVLELLDGMTNLQIDILNVLSFNEWLPIKDIRKKLEVECDRSFGDWSNAIITDLIILRNGDWVESKPDDNMTEEELAVRRGCRRFLYRKIKNGRRIPEKRSSWFGKLLGANN